MYSTGLCQPCYHKKYRLANKVWLANDKRADKYQKKYGISLAQYNHMFELQHGRCPICDGNLAVERNGKVWSADVDHDHDTGRVRGLLCHDCNINRVGSNTAASAARVLDYLKSDFDGRNIILAAQKAADASV